MNQDPAFSLEEQLWNELRTGQLQPGQKLPSTASLAKQFQLPIREVQAALASLSGRGVLDRKPRAGTFVKAQPRALTAGVLIGWNLNAEPSHMLRQFVELLKTELAQRHYGMEILHDLYSGLVNDYDEFRRATARLAGQLKRIDPCGLIEFQFHLDRLSDIYPSFTLPTVRVGMPEMGGDIYTDYADFIRTSLEYLASKGRRKVVLLRRSPLIHPAHREIEAFWSTLKREKFLRGHLREIFAGQQPGEIEKEAHHLTESLVREWATARRNYVPDCLVVVDDIMMRGVATALLKARIRVPEDLMVVALGNEGIHFHYGLPVVRYEFSHRMTARRLVEIFDLRVRKQPCPALPILIPGRIVEPGVG